MKKVGIFAGSFDPIHDGHLEVARNAFELLELNRIYFMVEEDSWGVKNPESVYDRQAMVDLAIALEDYASQIRLKDKRFDLDTTLPQLEQQFEDDELYFVFGADVFVKMSKKQWPGLEKLFNHYIVVFERGKIKQEDISKHAKELGITLAILPSTHPHHSSTDVRMNPHERELWLPEQVAEYIKTNNLYKSTDSSDL